MDKLIKASEQKSFSDKDILALTERKCVIRKYGELAKFRTLKQAWGKHKAMVILVETKPGYGHWVSVFSRPGGVIEVFEAYGLKLDEWLKYVPPAFAKESNQDEKHLTRLIINSKVKEVVVNDIRLQRFRGDVSTCGRWAGLRIALRDMTLPLFAELFLNQTFYPDWYATAMTFFVG